jgi:hypothetical protein
LYADYWPLLLSQSRPKITFDKEKNLGMMLISLALISYIHAGVTYNTQGTLDIDTGTSQSCSI